PPEEISFGGQTVTPKQGKVSSADEQRASYRLSNGIPAGQPLTFAQESDMQKRLALARNPYGPDRMKLAWDRLGLSEKEAGIHDAIAEFKAKAPLNRMIEAGKNSQRYIDDPTGPGDAALT